MFKPYIKEDIKDKALKHNELMEDAFHNEIQVSINNSIVYTDKDFSTERNIILEKLKTEEAVYKYGIDMRLCVLNFASYKYPGGGFINGAIAQEEALCHASNLYNVIGSEKFKSYYEHNRQDTNYGLYRNFAIYSPNIIFSRTYNDGITVDVITCPAPNLSNYHGTNELGHKTMYKRIKFILDIAEKNEVKNLVLGAFGCGVFRNEPEYVAKCFKELLKSSAYHFETIIFAIPSGENYDAFEKVFG